jgi:hypothetical protein
MILNNQTSGETIKGLQQDFAFIEKLSGLLGLIGFYVLSLNGVGDGRDASAQIYFDSNLFPHRFLSAFSAQNKTPTLTQVKDTSTRNPTNTLITVVKPERPSALSSTIIHFRTAFRNRLGVYMFLR